MKLVAPARERGLKSMMLLPSYFISLCRSREGAWIEMACLTANISSQRRRSREGAWIEIPLRALTAMHSLRRSREGAWIEIYTSTSVPCAAGAVAPARERGLK